MSVENGLPTDAPLSGMLLGNGKVADEGFKPMTNARKTEQEIQAEQAALYPSIPAEAEVMDEATVAFQEHEKRVLRCNTCGVVTDGDRIAGKCLACHGAANAANPVETLPSPVVEEPTAPPVVETDEQLLALAGQLRKQYLKSYRSGEHEYRKGLMEAGRLAHEYVVVQMRRGQKRDQAVKTIEGDLNAVSTTIVDANRLIRCYQSYRLLCEAQGLDKAAADMSYGAYTQGWSRLVEAVQQGRPEENYVLLPGMEQDCLALFADGVKGEWSMDSARTRCGELVLRAANAKAAAKAEQDTKAKADADAVNADKAKADAAKADAAKAKADADKVVADAAKAVTAAQTEDQRNAAQAQLDQQTKEMEERRKDLDARTAAADKLAREKIDADKRAEETAKQKAAADKAKDKLEAKNAKKEPGSIKVVSGTAAQGESLLVQLARTAKSGSVKDTGIMLANTMRQGDTLAILHDTVFSLLVQLEADKESIVDGSDVVGALLTALDGAPGLSPKARQAVTAAKGIMGGTESKPVKSNGTAQLTLTVSGK